MSAPCSECAGCGWVPYFQETLEGEDEMAWGLCRGCSRGSVAEQIENWEEVVSYMHQQTWLARRLGNPAMVEMFGFNKEEAMARVAALRLEIGGAA